MLHGMLLSRRRRSEVGKQERVGINKKTPLGRTRAGNNEEHISEIFARSQKSDIKNLIGCREAICVFLSVVPVWEWRR